MMAYASGPYRRYDEVLTSLIDFLLRHFSYPAYSLSRTDYLFSLDTFMLMPEVSACGEEIA